MEKGESQLFMERSLTVRVFYHTVGGKNDGFLVSRFLGRTQEDAATPKNADTATPMNAYAASPNPIAMIEQFESGDD